MSEQTNILSWYKKLMLIQPPENHFYSLVFNTILGIKNQSGKQKTWGKICVGFNFWRILKSKKMDLLEQTIVQCVFIPHLWKGLATFWGEVQEHLCK